jgi:hypothetical protein
MYSGDILRVPQSINAEVGEKRKLKKGFSSLNEEMIS